MPRMSSGQCVILVGAVRVKGREVAVECLRVDFVMSR